jgi:anti-sigma B factor antagonist
LLLCDGWALSLDIPTPPGLSGAWRSLPPRAHIELPADGGGKPQEACLPRCPVCGSARVVVVINRTRGAFCSDCGAQWAQRGSEQRNVRPFFPTSRQGRHLPVASPSLRIELFLDGRGVRLSGEVDAENMDRLEKALERLTSRGGDVVIDCAALTFMDSSGFGVLMQAARTLGDRGRLILNSPGDLIARTLRLMGIDRVPNIEIQELSTAPETGLLQPGPGAASRIELA